MQLSRTEPGFFRGSKSRFSTPRLRRFFIAVSMIAMVAVSFPVAANAGTVEDDEAVSTVVIEYPPGTETGDTFDASSTEIYPITFPVVGATYYTDTYGACRDGCTRRHKGIDIMGYGWKGIPVVAAHSGTISITTESAGRDCCAIWGLKSDDGWTSLYIHLNNDTPGTDDGKGWGLAPGIVVGAHVEEGQLIGWVGDSGNAEHVSPHLHFELRKNGVSVNPYPSLRAAKVIDMPRVAGPDRFATAIEASRDAFPDGADVAYVATGYNFPDALAGGPAAVKEDGPVLLSRVESLPPETLAELQRLSPSRIVILGGEEALAPKVEQDLAAVGADIVRLAGIDRYDTAAMISAMHFDPGIDVAFITSGTDFRDAVGGAPAAATAGAPMLLTRSDVLPSYTKDELTRLEPSRIVILGGTGAINAALEQELAAYATSGTVERVGGDTVYETTASISRWAHPEGATTAYVATVDTYVDALAGVSVAVRDGAPILLVGDDGLGPDVKTELERLGVDRVIALGGNEAVLPRIAMEVWSLLNDNDMPLWK